MGRPTDEQKADMVGTDGGPRPLRGDAEAGNRVPDLWNAYLNTCRSKGIEPSLKFLGHGIGRTIHEEPYLTETRDVELVPKRHPTPWSRSTWCRAAWASMSRTCT